jgi:hypothetical protein
VQLRSAELASRSERYFRPGSFFALRVLDTI